MHKATFFGAAAIALMAAAPAHAEGGYVGGVYGNVDVDGLGDADFYGIEGAFAGANFEIDGEFVDSDDFDSAFGITGHLFSRNDSHLFGGFLGIDDSNDSTSWRGGVEAAGYFDRWTLAGAVGFGSNDDLDTDGYGINAEARVFPTDNVRLQGTLGWTSLDVAGFDEDVMTYGLGGEFQLDAAPVSFGLDWDHSDADVSGIEADTLTARVRWNFGGTLLERDRSGASQASVTRLAL